MILMMAVYTLVCRAFAFQKPGIFGIAATTNAAKGWLASDDPDIALVAANSAAGGILDIEMEPIPGVSRSRVASQNVKDACG